MSSTSGSGQTVLELIAAGDVDAAAGFYDGRAPSVRDYFVQLCSSELADEATLAAFVGFRGRAASVPPTPTLTTSCGARPGQLPRHGWICEMRARRNAAQLQSCSLRE